MLQKIHLVVVLLVCACFLNAQTDLRVSDNHRYLVKKTDGKVFFWLADTGWEMLHRLSLDETDFYLKTRAEQGYTVIQTVILAELDGLRTPNANGETPLRNNDPSQPNEAYFKHVDAALDLAEKHGLHLALLPTWGDKIFKNRWGEGPEIFNPTNARAYGLWLGKRYAKRSNIVWVLGGDRNPRAGSQDVEIWRAMAAGITEGVGGADNALMTFHPQPSETCSSSNWFHDDNWLDFNMLQTGHCRDTPVWDKISGDYNHLGPVKPVVNGEPIYEDHPVCFNAKDLGYSSAYDVRKAAYLSFFAGALGHTYGCHDVWQFWDKQRTGVNGPLNSWRDALVLNGTNQLRHLRRLAESRPMLNRVPDQTLVTSSGTDAERVQAIRGHDHLLVYSSYGKPFTVQMGRISGEKVTAQWFDPRNGKSQDAGTLENRGLQTFTPPTNGQGQDWVLILDDTSKGYKAP